MTPLFELKKHKPVVHYLPDSIQEALSLLCKDLGVTATINRRDLWKHIDCVDFDTVADIVYTLGTSNNIKKAHKLLKEYK